MISLDVGSGVCPHGDINVELYYPRSIHTEGLIKKPTVICDAHQLPFQDGMFDEVYCIHTLEHLHCPFVCLTEILRVMKNGAILHIHLPNASAVKWERPQHLYSWTRFSLKWILLSVGFKVPKQVELSGTNMKVDAYK